jgi:hypothetical protein
MDETHEPSRAFPLLDVSDVSKWRSKELERELELRGIPVPKSGSKKNKRTFAELLDNFQRGEGQIPPAASDEDLYIDPETLNDTDPRFDSAEKLEVLMQARKVVFPPHPDGVGATEDQYWELCWAALSAWVHSEANQKPPDVPDDGDLSGDEIEQRQREQQEAVLALQAADLARIASENEIIFNEANRQRLETATLASMPGMFGEQAVVPTRGTFATPVTDKANSKLFTKSFYALKDVYHGFANLKDLIPLRARDLVPNNVVAWAHTVGAANTLTNMLIIYRVLGVGVSYVSVTQLSECPSTLTGVPERNGQLTLDTPVFGLSLDSIENIRRLFSIPAMRASGMTLDFPPNTLAINDQQRRLAWSGETIDLDDEDGDGVNCFGAEVLPTSDTAGGSSTPATGTRSALKKKAGSGDSEKDFAAAIRDLAKSTSHVETKKTVGGYLREEQAAVLSTEPTILLKQGNLEVLQRMSYYHLASTSSSTEVSRAAFWGLQGPFRTQLQAAHLITMLQSMVSVDIRLFADMHVVLGKFSAQNLADRCAASDAITIDASIPTDLEVVGKESARFEHLLRNFAFVVDNLLLLCPVIREAMRNMLSRFIQHAQRMLLDPTDIVTALLYIYWAHEFQSAVNQAYTMVKTSVLTSADAVAEFWAAIPNTCDHFQPFLQGQLHIQHHKVFPYHITLTPPSTRIHGTSLIGSMSSQSPSQPQSLSLSASGSSGGRGGGGKGAGGRGNSSQGGTDKKDKLCVFYITTSHDGKNDGCKKQPCDYKHRKYTADEAKQAWVTDFLTRNKRTLDPAKRA